MATTSFSILPLLIVLAMLAAFVPLPMLSFVGIALGLR